MSASSRSTTRRDNNRRSNPQRSNPQRGNPQSASQSSRPSRSPTTPSAASPKVKEWSKQIDGYDDELLDKYYKFIGGVLALFIKDPEERRDLRSNENLINYWIPAFTDATVDPNPVGNYQVLEHIGDKTFGTEFTVYMIDVLPGLEELQYTELGVYYTSNEYMKELSDELGFRDYIRIVVDDENEITDAVMADIFESFCGALRKSGDTIRRGLGSAYIFNFIEYLFRNVKFDMIRAAGNFKTQFIQLFETLGMMKVKFDHFHKDFNRRETTIKIIIPSNGVDLLSKNGINLPRDTMTRDGLEVASVTDRYKNEASTKAFNKAFEYLLDYGVTPTLIQNIKNKRLLSRKELASYTKRALPVFKNQGYITFTFNKPLKLSTPDGFTLVLQGILENGERENIYVQKFKHTDPDKVRKEEELEAQQQLLERFTKEYK